MHKDIAMELEGGIHGDIVAQQAALETWTREFNRERPHEALGMRVPSDMYVPSSRRYDPSEIEMSYPSDCLRRKVNTVGVIRIHGRSIGISTALSGWDVGLKPTGLSRYSVWFGPLCLGELDWEIESFQAARQNAEGGAPPHTPGFSALTSEAGDETGKKEESAL